VDWLKSEAQLETRGEQSQEKVARRLRATALRTVVEHRLIDDGDRILVGVSGGKDSYALVDLLWAARRRAPVRFEVLAFHLDQAQPSHDPTPLRGWLEQNGIPHEIHREDTYRIVRDHTEEGRAFCRLCSRLRRGAMYAAAERHGCNKIALGHHRDDSLETLLLNLFYAGRLQAMPARYRTNDDRFEVIRPLVACAESDLSVHARARGYPILPCRLCGSQPNLKRDVVKRLLTRLEGEIPDVRAVMLAALANVRPSHLLDREVAEAWEASAERYPPRR